MTSRTFIPTLLDAVVYLCKLIARAKPVVVRKYKDSHPELITALEEAATNCALLSTILAEIREYGI